MAKRKSNKSGTRERATFQSRGPSGRAYVHDFLTPEGGKFRVIFLGEGDVIRAWSSTKKTIHGPGMMVQYVGAMSLDTMVVWGCTIQRHYGDGADGIELSVSRAVTYRLPKPAWPKRAVQGCLTPTGLAADGLA